MLCGLSRWWCNKGSRIRSGGHCLLPQTWGIPPPPWICASPIYSPPPRRQQSMRQCAPLRMGCAATYILLRQYVVVYITYAAEWTPISNYVTRRCKGRTVSMELNHHQPHWCPDNSYQGDLHPQNNWLNITRGILFRSRSLVVQSRSYI